MATGLPVEFMDIQTRTQWNMLGEAVAGELEGSRLEQLPAYNSMWFAWATFWPNTEVWTGEGIIDADSVPPLEPTTTAVDEEFVNAVSAAFALGKNFPNPFNPQTQIQFAVPADGLVRLTVHNTAGQLVSTLVDGHRTAGLYLVGWDGRGDAGLAVASGTYIYRLELHEQGLSATRGMTLVR